MKLISSTIELNQLTIVENKKQQEDIKELKIFFINQTFSSFKQLAILPQIVPNLNSLTLKFVKSNLNSSFLVILKETIESLKCLSEIDFYFHKNKNITLKTTKQFITYIKSKFYKDSKIEYSFQDDQIVLSCGKCQLSINQSSTQSIWIKEINDKILYVNIQRNQQDFQKIIRQKIENEIENLDVQLHCSNKLLIHCQNGSQSHQIQIILNFEEIVDLFKYPIFNCYLVVLKIFTIFLKNPLIEKRLINQLTKQRYNFSCGYGYHMIFLISFKEETISQKKYAILKEKLSQYNFNFSCEINLNTQFKMNFYKDFVFPQMINTINKKPYEINFYLNMNHLGIQDLQVLKLKYFTAQKNNRQKFDLKFRKLDDIVEMVKFYFNSCSELDSDIITLTLKSFKQVVLDLSEFYQQLSNLDTKNYVKKLSLKLSETDNINQQFSIIESITNLKIISLKFNNFQNLIQFLKINNSQFKFQKEKNNLLTLVIDFDKHQYYQNIPKELAQGQITNFDRICQIIVYQISIIDKYDHLTNYFRKFKRLVTLQTYQLDRQRIKVYKSNYDQYNFLDYLICQDGVFQDYDYHHKEYSKYNLQYFSWYIEYVEMGHMYSAYQQIDHDNINCSYSNIENCTCNNNQIQKLMKFSQFELFENYHYNFSC